LPSIAKLPSIAAAAVHPCIRARSGVVSFARVWLPGTFSAVLTELGIVEALACIDRGSVRGVAGYAGVTGLGVFLETVRV
jgi:hypothetical protein